MGTDSIESSLVPDQKGVRLDSLDMFRGITMAGMTIVNNPGNWTYVYPALRHSVWNGWTPTDLVFPFFVFIMGTAIPFSFSRRLEEGGSKWKIFLKVLRRTVILFVIGLVLNGFPTYDFHTLRIMGVLQRLALCYFFASVLFLNFTPKSQVYWGIGLLTFYWLAMKLVPVPGYGPGVLTNTGNLSAYVDNLLLSGHIWAGSKLWDPEGPLSTIPAIATCISGVLTGVFLKSRKTDYEKTTLMFFAGSIGLLLGSILDIWFPINKNLWSPSYVVFTSGMALIFLACCYFIADIKKAKRLSKPFIVLGMNAIALYFLSELFAVVLYIVRVPLAGEEVTLQDYIYRIFCAPWAGDLNGSLFYALMYTLFWFAILLFMYRKKIFIRI